jgi:hypothetical protein
MIELKRISLIKALFGSKREAIASKPSPALVEINPADLRQVSGGTKVAGGAKLSSPIGSW